MILGCLLWTHTQKNIHPWVNHVIEKYTKKIMYSKVIKNSTKSNTYPIFNEIQNNNIKTFVNRVNTPPSTLKNNCENEIANNIISQSQPPIIYNIYNIHTHDNINNS